MNLSFPTIVMMLLACASPSKADGISFRPDDGHGGLPRHPSSVLHAGGLG